MKNLFTSKSIHLLLLLLQNIPLIQAQDIFLTCAADSSNYTSGSQFETNLKTHLLPSLISNGSLNNGFFNTFSGNSPDSIVYGLVQCRGDISMDDCKTCLNTSSVLIIQKCPNVKDAVIRLEFCLLRYSSLSFFSEDDTSRPLMLSDSHNVFDPVVFNRQLGELMNHLASMATSKPSKFETGSIRYSNFSNIYGMVQCTLDLSSIICSSCLQGLINSIPSCCNGKRAGHILRKSCFVRFEDSLFYQVLPPPSPTVKGSLQPPTDAGNGDDAGQSKGSSSNIVAIVVPIVITGALLLLAVCVCFLRRKRRMNTRKSDGDRILSADSLQFDLVTVRIATKDFSNANKLGEGGFGAVYKIP